MAKILKFIMPNWAESIDANFKWERLHDACECIVDCPHSTPNYDEHGDYRVARTQDIRTGVFDYKNAARVNGDTYSDRIKRCQPEKGDILYSREGTYFGDAALIAHDNVCLGQRMVLLRPNSTKYTSQFVLYWLNSIFMQNHLKGLRDGSVAERLNMSTIRSLPIARPPLKNQKAIAHILGTIDDKIDLNRRMNETLEAMAQAIFKSWFVDFDGCTEFEDSELGQVPKGWRVGKIKELGKIVTGKTPPSKYAEHFGNTYPFVTPTDFKNYFKFAVKTKRGISEKGCLANKTRIIPPKSVLVTCIGSDMGKVVISTKDCFTNQQINSIIFKHNEISCEYAYLYLKNIYKTLRMLAHGGSTMPIINKTDFGNIDVLIPDAKTLSEVQPYFADIDKKIESNIWENETLLNLRDTLLPKLISGELRVDEAENIVEDA